MRFISISKKINRKQTIFEQNFNLSIGLIEL